MKNDQKESSFVDHLVELRERLIHSIIFLFILFVVSYFFSEKIYSFLVNPYAEAVKESNLDRRLIFTALQETFLTYLKVSFFTAFFFTSPYILMQIWKFIAPGLYDHEKSAIMPYLVITPILFLLGGMLVYYLVMPLAIKFFLSFESSALETSLPIQLEAKVNEYLSLVMKLIFAMKEEIPEKKLNRNIRAHGNFSEYVPIFLILLLCLEYENTLSFNYLLVISLVYSFSHM